MDSKHFPPSLLAITIQRTLAAPRQSYATDFVESSTLTMYIVLARKRTMAKRSKDWNMGLAQDLRNPEFAREFLLAAIEEGVSVQVALGKVIRAIGVKEFANKIAVASPNILRAINSRHNPTQETLNRLLKPFKLKLSLAPIDQTKRRRAA